MKLTSTPLIAVDLDAAAFGPGHGADPAAWLEPVRALDQAGVSFITLADRFDGSDGVARIDAVMLAGWLSARTGSIGVMAAADTTVSEPFLLAVQIATADFVSGGRAGWLVQVSGRDVDAGYVGPRRVLGGPAAWEEAREYVEIVRALWDSWEDGAEIRDVAGQRFLDRDRIHAIDYVGRYLSVKGPSITPRSPQGQPPVGVAVANSGEEWALSLALAQADVLFLGTGFSSDAVRSRAAEQGHSVRLLADVPLAELSVGRVGEALSDGFHGVRVIPGGLPDDVASIVDRVGALALGPVAAGTFRQRLSLPRPWARRAESVA